MTVRAVVWAVTIGLAAAVGGIFYCHPPEQPSDWASWASAIGTVAAVFAAIWATFAAEDRQSRDALRSARITSVALTSLVSRLVEDLEQIETRLENVVLNGTGPASAAHLAEQFGKLTVPSEEQLLRLSHAPGNMAVSISYALSNISFAVSQLSPAEMQKHDNDGRYSSDLARVAVNAARTTLKTAINGMVQFHSALKSAS